MAITFDSTGRPAYMFKGGATSSDGVWYPIAAKIDTAASYTFTAANIFSNDDFQKPQGSPKLKKRVLTEDVIALHFSQD